MCKELNRDGLLCSRCKAGFGPAPYSSDLKCLKCNDDNRTRQWLLYLALELVPSTVFYLVVVLFNVRTTAPPYTAFVFFSQFFALLYKIHPYFRINLNSRINKVLLQGILTLISFWNLDFLRHVVPPFCISSRLTDLHAVLLECISALYPLFLVVFTFACIELHARNFRPLVILWKPIHKYFTNCRRRLDPKSSVIAAFATFISLSFSKVLFITFLISFPGMYGEISNPYTRHYYKGMYDTSITGNSSTEYFKKLAHAPYFLPLLIMAVVMQLPTLLLLLYPIKAFRRLLTCCGSSRYHAINIFMDTFQGHYKDGTNGSRDYRAASSISFLLRTLFCAILSNDLTRQGLPMQSDYSFIVYCLVVISLFYGVIQPCKKKYMNVIESVVYCAAGLMLISFGSGHSQITKGNRIGVYFSFHTSLVFLVLPSIVLMSSFITKISACLCCACNRCTPPQVCYILKLMKRRDNDSDRAETPDRLKHPLDYEPIP